MVGCSAIGCSNRSEQGFAMKVFPKNLNRRREWAAKVKRENWTPTDRSFLCEVHFEAEMWEAVREDGTKKLKWNAVPTLFSFVKEKRKRKPPTPKEDPAPKKKRKILLTDEQQPSTSKVISLGNSSSSNSECEIPVLATEDCNTKKIMQKMKEYETSYSRLSRKFKVNRCKLRNLRRITKKHAQDNKESTYVCLHHKVFNEDQLAALERRSTRFMRWSNPTIMKALKLKFACGVTGYDELLKQKMPLPSLRTLRRRLENIPFDSGILDQVFLFLKIKVSAFVQEHEKDCVILLDEMAITPGTTFDTGSKSYLGNVTLPGHSSSDVATHALVIMIGGVTTRWKQTVAYYFTSDSVDGTVYQQILFDVIGKTESLGLKVISITSDMGASNQALWKCWSITAGRFSTTTNYITHPFDESRKVYIFADVPHLFKNIKNMLVTNKIITISSEIQSLFNLPTNVIKIDHIKDLIDYQNKLDFKLAPKLSEEDLTPTHFRKMRVSTSTNVVSHDVASGLKFISHELKRPEYLTTAWFLETVEKWFSLMASRHPVMALSKMKLEVYQEAKEFLESVMTVFQTMNVGAKHTWKPSQTGLLISTKSMLDVQHLLLEEKSYTFLLTSRFTQDSLENLFGILRSKQSVPNALQFKNHLKLVTVSQFLKDVSKGSYEKDDREFLADFLEYIPKTPIEKPSDAILPENFEVESISLNLSEQNSLYRVAGYLVTSIVKNSGTCARCIESVGSRNYIDLPYSKLVKLKCFKINSLFYSNEETFNFFSRLEIIFRQFFSFVQTQNINLKLFFVNKMLNDCSDVMHILPCHNLKKKIVNRFAVFRLKIASKRLISKKKLHASKTVMSTSL